MGCIFCFFFFKQKTAYEMRISDWSSDVCSSGLVETGAAVPCPHPVPPLRVTGIEDLDRRPPMRLAALLDLPTPAISVRLAERRQRCDDVGESLFVRRHHNVSIGGEV